MLAHGPELEARDGLGCMAGQNLTGRRDVERPAPPSAQARLGVACEIVRHDGVDDDDAVVAFPQSFDITSRALDLLSGRHQLRAVRNSPAVILNMGNLDPSGTERYRLVNHDGDAVDIGTMDDGVDGERNAEPHHLSGESAFAHVSAVVASDPVRRGGISILD